MYETSRTQRKMNNISLIVQHRSKPGHRDRLRSVWERFIKACVVKNPGHLAYYFSYDLEDPDRVIAFQIFSDIQAKDEFLNSEWYPNYLEQISEHIAEPPIITTASLIWSKTDRSTEQGVMPNR